MCYLISLNLKTLYNFISLFGYFIRYQPIKGRIRCCSRFGAKLDENEINGTNQNGNMERNAKSGFCLVLTHHYL